VTFDPASAKNSMRLASTGYSALKTTPLGPSWQALSPVRVRPLNQCVRITGNTEGSL
jgi:hypothetical protein